jgi:hypothetical protein
LKDKYIEPSEKLLLIAKKFGHTIDRDYCYIDVNTNNWIEAYCYKCIECRISIAEDERGIKIKGAFAGIKSQVHSDPDLVCFRYKGLV